MRSCLLGVLALSTSMVSGAWAGDGDIGFPAHAFSFTWAALPTGRFQPILPTTAPVRDVAGCAVVTEDARMREVVDGAFASAADDRGRREIALDEMMTPWPQPQKWAFQRVRDAQLAFAGDDDRAAARFAALAGRVAEETGRSAAVDVSASAVLDAALAATLSRQDDAGRAATEAAQATFVAYRDAFAAFADARSPGTGAGVAAELDRQRATDLGAAPR